MEIARLTLMTWVVIVLLFNNSLVYSEELKKSATSTTTLPQAKVFQLASRDVTAMIASSGALSGNAKRHFRSANVVHGFESPQDKVTWTVIAPQEDDYVVSVLFSKRNQAKLEVSSGDSVRTGGRLSARLASWP